MEIHEENTQNRSSTIVNMVLFVATGIMLAYPQAMLDIYLPVLPYLDKALNTTKELVQYTVVFFLLGNAISQLVSGVLSDRFGRVQILVFGLFIVIVGSIICYLEYTIQWIMVGRVLQGIGAGMAAVLTRVIIADVFRGVLFSRIYAMLIAFSILTIAVAPIISGYLMQYYGWHSVMLFMLCYAGMVTCIATAGLFFGGKFLSSPSRKQLDITVVFKILLNAQFLSATFIMFFVYGVSASVLLAYPYIFVQEYNMPVSAFGWVIGLVILCMLIGAGLNSFFLKKYGMLPVIRTALVIMLFSMVGVILSSMSTTYVTDLICLSAFWLVFLWVYPNLIALVTDISPEYKGTAVALFSFIQITGGVVFTAFGAWHVLDKVYELGITGVIGLCFAMICFKRLKLVIPRAPG